MNAQAQPTTEDVIKQGLALRDEIAVIKKRHAEELAAYESGLAACELWLLKVMQDRREANIKTKFGTAFQSEQLRVTMEDRNDLIEYVFDPLQMLALNNPVVGNTDVIALLLEAKNRMGFFTNHVAKEHAKEFMEKHAMQLPDGRTVDGPPPPGVKVDRFIACHIRKA